MCKLGNKLGEALFDNKGNHLIPGKNITVLNDRKNEGIIAFVEGVGISIEKLNTETAGLILKIIEGNSSSLVIHDYIDDRSIKQIVYEQLFKD